MKMRYMLIRGTYSVCTWDIIPLKTPAESKSGDNAIRTKISPPVVPRHLDPKGTQTIWNEWPHFPSTGHHWTYVSYDFMKVSIPRSRLLHTERTVIARKLAGWTSAVKLNATDATDLILRHVPAPGCNRIPFLDRDLHLRTKVKKKRYIIHYDNWRRVG